MSLNIEEIVFDESLQRNEFELQCQFRHLNTTWIRYTLDSHLQCKSVHSICGGSAMFNACHFLLMVSLKNKTSSSTFIPCAIVILKKYNIGTWIATKCAAYS
ncbi:hypothetical protein H5410_017746, partial [Solanum commersonii]